MTYQLKCNCGNVAEVDDIPLKSWEFYSNYDKNATCCAAPDYHIYYPYRKKVM